MRSVALSIIAILIATGCQTTRKTDTLISFEQSIIVIQKDDDLEQLFLESEINPLQIEKEIGAVSDSPELPYKGDVITEVTPTNVLNKVEIMNLLNQRNSYQNDDIKTASIESKTDKWTEKKNNKPLNNSNNNVLWSDIVSKFGLPNLPESVVTGNFSSTLHKETELKRFLNKGSLYLPFVLEEVKNRGFPAEIALLPYVESGYSPFAVSSQGAVGMWQIMPFTGKELGLSLRPTCDQRRDLISGTKAALDYLEMLLAKFDGNWLLAISAYNAGPARVKKELKRKPGASVWELKLPPETRRYLPRLIVLRDLIRSAYSNGRKLPNIQNKISYSQITLKAPMEVSLVKKLSGTSLETIRKLNPCIRTWITPPQPPYQITLPRESASKFAQKLVSLPVRDYIRSRPYKIEQGDTLTSITKTGRSSVKELMLINGMSDTRLVAGRTLLIPSSGENIKAQLTILEKVKIPENILQYRVKSGDTLWSIAQRFKTKVKILRKLNNPSNLIKTGQWLSIPIH